MVTYENTVKSGTNLPRNYVESRRGGGFIALTVTAWAYPKPRHTIKINELAKKKKPPLKIKEKFGTTSGGVSGTGPKWTVRRAKWKARHTEDNKDVTAGTFAGGWVK